MTELIRCSWSGSDPVYLEYHDKEWGVPVRDDRKQYEFLVLESAQAGLSWLTILKRRDGYRRLYEKIESSINNARRFLEVREQYGSFCNYFWGFTDGKQVVNHFTDMSEIPATTPLSDTIAKDLKGRGFQFLGSTTIYAHLQATGLVNDHLVDCFRHMECMEQ